MLEFAPGVSTQVELYTLEDVAQKFRVTVRTVRTWIAAGEMPAARIGKQYFMTEEDVQAFLRRRKVRRPEREE